MNVLYFCLSSSAIGIIDHFRTFEQSKYDEAGCTHSSRASASRREREALGECVYPALEYLLLYIDKSIILFSPLIINHNL